ncbi:DUF1549 domain-containing protein [Botrimarina hoheduenensis]|uniref:DUF1549 domain-containing protein n=1 Tax=Botrimarina hoheduenensis TaxID=2528000 RepID=A0A5C5WBS1_9BACT|nr:DUF1549 domain-containing protein [Botrimarina hoheduenensis]TWT47501.1 hypothetical protein Pla111_11150 [Botrimarina hoheduenensis]
MLLSSVLSVALLLSSAAVSGAPTLADDNATSEQIDALLKASWKLAGVSPSPRAPDGAWARRLYLDLIGRIPTVDELQAFAAEKPAERRTRLIDRLLSDEYRDERVAWQATEAAILLVGRTGGTTGNSPVHRPGLVQYLREAFAENRPHDQLMRQLVTATGSVRPEDEDFNGAANFLADKLADDGVQATARTAQLFLGVSVQCTQCHEHPFNEQKQSQFWELNAFFRQARVERIRDEDSNRRYGRIVDRDFLGQGVLRQASLDGSERAQIFYELRNGRLKVAYPTFIDGTPLADVMAERGLTDGDTGRLARVNRRAELADLIAASPEFARVSVNREWARLMGYGMVRPPEDMGPHNPASHPELLETLAEAFRQSGFDRLQLTRWIVSTDAYGLDSRAGVSNRDDDPSLGVPPLYSRFYLRQLSAEQIYDSLITATRADEGLEETERAAARRRWLRQFTTAQENDENGEATSFNGSISQTLAMMNSDVMRRATELDTSRWRPAPAAGSASLADAKPQGFLSSIAADPTQTDAQRIERLYLAALARMPERGERRMAEALLATRAGDVGQTLRDVWWALLNSNEFILNH